MYLSCLQLLPSPGFADQGNLVRKQGGKRLRQACRCSYNNITVQSTCPSTQTLYRNPLFRFSAFSVLKPRLELRNHWPEKPSGHTALQASTMSSRHRFPILSRRFELSTNAHTVSRWMSASRAAPFIPFFGPHLASIPLLIVSCRVS